MQPLPLLAPHRRSWIRRHPILFTLLILTGLLLCSCFAYSVIQRMLAAAAVNSLATYAKEAPIIYGHVTSTYGTSVVSIDETLVLAYGVDRRVAIEQDCFTLQGAIWQRYQGAGIVAVQMYDDTGKQVGHCAVSAGIASNIGWSTMSAAGAWNLYDDKSFVN